MEEMVIHCNRPFPSSKKSHFQNEAKCETFVVKMSFICMIIKNHFHINGFALSLTLKVRLFGTRKWPIAGSSNLLEFCSESKIWAKILSKCDLVAHSPLSVSKLLKLSGRGFSIENGTQ